MTTDDSVRVVLADAMAAAASEFLASLDDRQREAANWTFPSNEERRLWFYTPTDHGGIPLNAMSPAQQQLAFKLVATGLSRAAYVTVSTIIGLENTLDELEGWVASWGRERGRDPGLYYLRIFGDPSSPSDVSTDRNWSWRFGGHHVSLNHTIVDGAVAAVTPCFLGADPASSPLLGTHPLRPLAGAEDLGRELVLSLTDAQRTIAVVSDIAPIDLVGANRSTIEDGALPQPLSEIWRGQFTGSLAERVDTMQNALERAVGVQLHHNMAVQYTGAPKGLQASALTNSQQQTLRSLLDVYLRRMPDALAEIEIEKFAGTRLEQLSFLWAGSFEPGVAHYYRIQGPRLVVEYDNAARTANHVHTVWRDPEGDFATDTLADHYRTHH
jgi:Protein of unknown function (DUF3500)